MNVLFQRYRSEIGAYVSNNEKNESTVERSGKGSDSQLIRHPFFNYSRRLRGDCASTNVPFQRTARVRKQLLVYRAMR